MAILRYLEYYLARLLYNSKGRDAKLFTNNATLFANVPKNIELTSPDVGPSGSHLGIEHSALGASRFPELSWSLAPDADISHSDIKEYILLCEDPDAPLPIVPNHGMYYAIPPAKTHIGPEDLQVDTARQAGEAKWLKGGFRLGKNIRGTIYGGPRPQVGHGEHRYIIQVVALREKLDLEKMKPVATKAELEQAIRGKIIGYGVWIGIFEHKWE